MTENEPQPKPELTIRDLILILSEFVEEEVLEELSEMDFDDAVGYGFTLLLNSEKFLELDQDPEEFLTGKGVFE